MKRIKQIKKSSFVTRHSTLVFRISDFGFRASDFLALIAFIACESLFVFISVNSCSFVVIYSHNSQ